MTTPLEWRISNTPTFDWERWVRRLGGGFFHTPAVVRGRPDSREVLRLICGSPEEDRVHGLAVGTLSRPRWALGMAVANFPTLPLFGDAAPDPLFRDLISTLEDLGVGAASFGSFDATWTPRVLPPGARISTRRLELVVSIAVDPDELLSRFHSTHRRRVRTGIRDGWRIRRLDAREGTEKLLAVQMEAAQRAAERDDEFEPSPLSEEEAREDDLAPGSSGSGVWAAEDSDGRLLGALYLGWGGERVFYLRGGSTPEGYEAGASQWTHWRIMTEMADVGFTSYNLGGVPGEARDPDHAASGLLRFKRSFGAEIKERADLAWTGQGGVRPRLFSLTREIAKRVRGS